MSTRQLFTRVGRVIPSSFRLPARHIPSPVVGSTRLASSSSSSPGTPSENNSESTESKSEGSLASAFGTNEEDFSDYDPSEDAALHGWAPISNSSKLLNPLERQRRSDTLWKIDDHITKMKPGEEESSSLGHLILRERRDILKYMRMIETEVPQLEQFRKPFQPPTSATPIVTRTISYGAEEHPASRKGTIVVPIESLPLKTPSAIHKFKLLAGVRWHSVAPRDSGFASHETEESEHGFFKIAHEAFPESQMNLKWCSDVLDKLILEANDQSDAFADIPLDTRHLEAHAKKVGISAKRPEQTKRRPSIQDFPLEWLPKRTPKKVAVKA